MKFAGRGMPLLANVLNKKCAFAFIKLNLEPNHINHEKLSFNSFCISTVFVQF